MKFLSLSQQSGHYNDYDEEWQAVEANVRVEEVKPSAPWWAWPLLIAAVSPLGLLHPYQWGRIGREWLQLSLRMLVSLRVLPRPSTASSSATCVRPTD